MRLSKSPKGLQFIKNQNNAYGKLYDTMIFVQIGHTITLNSGGWNTMHTKKCLNLIFKDLGLDLYVQQKKGQWFVHVGDIVRPFVDGMQVLAKNQDA